MGCHAFIGCWLLEFKLGLAIIQRPKASSSLILVLVRYQIS